MSLKNSLLLATVVWACLGAASAQTGHAWLCSADEERPGVVFQSDFWEPDGEKKKLVVADRPCENCPSFPLPFAASEVLWAGLGPGSWEADLAPGVILQGRPQEGTVEDVSPLVDPPGAFVEPVAGAAPADGARPPRSGWWWRPREWQERADVLFAGLRDWGMSRVFITVTVKDGAVEKEALLREFIARASQRGVEVWAVEGDRYALLPEERPAFLDRARAFEAYNKSVPEDERLAGLQYDIEPYLMEGYRLSPHRWNGLYRDFLAQVKQTTALPLEVALPFWFAGQKVPEGGLFLDAVTTSISSVVVMDYRTERRQIVDFARPFLAWGVRQGRPVHIALETVTLPDLDMAVYRPSRRGTLWMKRQGEITMLFLLRGPVEKTQDGHLFSFSHRTTSPASQTTFFGRTDVLRALLPELEQELSEWPSFAGTAVHGTDSETTR